MCIELRGVGEENTLLYMDSFEWFLWFLFRYTHIMLLLLASGGSQFNLFILQTFEVCSFYSDREYKKRQAFVLHLMCGGRRNVEVVVDL